MLYGYRIVSKKWAANAFDGEGARLYGGRWNSKGNSCVYLAGSESLAMLEMLVHLQNSELLASYELYQVTFGQQAGLTIDDADLPSNWQENPAPTDTAEIGDQWLKSLASPILSVPSTIVPRERNYLLNIQHPDANLIVQSATRLDFQFDLRLIK